MFARQNVLPGDCVAEGEGEWVYWLFGTEHRTDLNSLLIGSALFDVSQRLGVKTKRNKSCLALMPEIK